MTVCNMYPTAIRRFAKSAQEDCGTVKYLDSQIRHCPSATANGLSRIRPPYLPLRCLLHCSRSPASFANKSSSHFSTKVKVSSCSNPQRARTCIRLQSQKSVDSCATKPSGYSITSTASYGSSIWKRWVDTFTIAQAYARWLVGD
jgi:hypothetical protein